MPRPWILQHLRLHKWGRVSCPPLPSASILSGEAHLSINHPNTSVPAWISAMTSDRFTLGAPTKFLKYVPMYPELNTMFQEELAVQNGVGRAILLDRTLWFYKSCLRWNYFFGGGHTIIGSYYYYYKLAVCKKIVLGRCLVPSSLISCLYS